MHPTPAYGPMQSKLLVDQEIHQTTLATLKKAVTDQEAVITRLQQVCRKHSVSTPYLRYEGRGCTDTETAHAGLLSSCCQTAWIAPRASCNRCASLQPVSHFCSSLENGLPVTLCHSMTMRLGHSVLLMLPLVRAAIGSSCCPQQGAGGVEGLSKQAAAGSQPAQVCHHSVMQQ